MANIHITESTTVAQLKKQFNKDVGGTLRVYKNRSEADEDASLVSIGTIEGGMEYRMSRTVGRFEESFAKNFNLKVKVFTPDNWVKVLDGITLETIKKLPRQINKLEMAKFIAYKRSVPKFPNPNKPNGHYEKNEIIENNLPCAKSIEKYERERASLQNYVDQEAALERLFNDLCPKNKDLEDILIKCSTLNDFYSTYIYNVYAVGLHYKTIEIDKRLEKEDLTLVDELAHVPVGDDKEMRFYSFATKYCSHHRPDTYPIYDSFVDNMLRYFRNRDRFYEFSNDDLKVYKKFKEIINEFKSFYFEDDFSLLQIDNYLWLLGKEVEIAKEKKRKETKVHDS